VSRLAAFLRHLVAGEPLPRDAVPLPVRRRGFLRTLVAWETLPRDEAPAPTRPRSLLRWLVGRERLPEDPPNPGPGGEPDGQAPRKGEP
jgi:hypothetical protein